jgi:phosphopantothenoylcysteine decarboxylase/phosphopantothenate--cysteine ligase
VPTPDALRFVGEATWAALSGEPVTTDVWTGVAEVPHVRLGQSADLVLVAPATADLLARAAAGMSGDLLTATLLTARCPVLYAPAMHTEMWEHPATQANVALLRSRGADRARARGRPAHRRGQRRRPAAGAGRDLRGRDGCSPAAGRAARGRPHAADLAGRPGGGVRGRHPGGDRPGPVHRQLVHRDAGLRAGPDGRRPGRRGDVVAANVALPDPAGAKVTRVVSARDMQAAVTAAAARRRCVVMAAAVADYRPQTRSRPRSRRTVSRPSRSADREPGHPGRAGRCAADRRPGPGPRRVRRRDRYRRPEAARAKLARKGCDLLVVNPVGKWARLRDHRQRGVVYGADGTVTQIPRGPRKPSPTWSGTWWPPT